jgi:hypothetical protein
MLLPGALAGNQAVPGLPEKTPCGAWNVARSKIDLKEIT